MPEKLGTDGHWDAFYWARWWEATEDMSCTQRGVYITLLAHCYMHGSITANLRTLAGICRVDSKTMDRVWNNPVHPLKDKFVVGSDGRLRNKRQLRARGPKFAPREDDVPSLSSDDEEIQTNGRTDARAREMYIISRQEENLAKVWDFFEQVLKVKPKHDAFSAIRRLGTSPEDIPGWEAALEEARRDKGLSDPVGFIRSKALDYRTAAEAGFGRGREIDFLAQAEKICMKEERCRSDAGTHEKRPNSPKQSPDSGDHSKSASSWPTKGRSNGGMSRLSFGP